MKELGPIRDQGYANVYAIVFGLAGDATEGGKVRDVVAAAWVLPSAATWADCDVDLTLSGPFWFGDAPAGIDSRARVVALYDRVGATADPAVDTFIGFGSVPAANALLNELTEADGAVRRFTQNALEQGPNGATTLIDGIPQSSVMELFLAWLAGKSVLTDNGDGTKTVAWKKQNGVTTKFTVTINAKGEHTLTSIV